MVDYEDETSAQIVASIDDLLISIFLRLPITSLLRFKSVSKPWNLIISSPKFSDLLDHEPKPAVGLIFQSKCSNINPSGVTEPFHSYVVSFDPSTHPPFRKLDLTDRLPCGFSLLRSCNGLLLVRGHDSPNLCYVCNPTTNKYTALPEIEFGAWESVSALFLAFEPSKSPHYKVVYVRTLDFFMHKHEVEVYSSETRCWRKCGEPFIARVIGDGVYWNGAIHWIDCSVSEESIYINLDDDDQIMPRVMPMPPSVTGLALGLECCYYFGESCGHLHYVYAYRTWGVIMLNVYEMRRDYSEWFVKYRVDLSNIVGPVFYICTLVRGKRDGDSFLVLQFMGKFIWYNFVYGTYGIICAFEGADLQDYFTSPPRDLPLMYIESLCPV